MSLLVSLIFPLRSGLGTLLSAVQVSIEHDLLMSVRSIQRKCLDLQYLERSRYYFQLNFYSFEG